MVPGLAAAATGIVSERAPGIDMRIIVESFVEVSAVVTVKVPVSDPVDHLYAQPTAIVVVPEKSANSVKLAPHPENSALVLLPSYSTAMAIRRSPAFFVSDERSGKVLVAPPAVLLVRRIRLPVGIVGNAIPYRSCGR